MSDPAPPSHDLIHTFLATRDEPCPGCNYNLRGLTRDKCPECGWTPKLCLDRKPIGVPRIAPWLAVASLVAALASAVYGFISFASRIGSGLPYSFQIRYYAMSGIYAVLAFAGLVTSAIAWRRKGPESGRRAVVVSALSLWLAYLLYQLGASLTYELGLW